jgi:murein DD-endopeptidase MepM/ murein hydrolase activator NlpD
VRFYKFPSTSRWLHAVSLLVAVTSATVLAAASSAAGPSRPDPVEKKQKVDRQIEILREQLEDTTTELADAYVALRTTEAAIPSARDVFGKAEAKASSAERARSLAVRELAASVARETKAEAHLGEATQEVARNRTRVAQFAAQIYQEQGFGQLDMALSSGDPQQFADRIALVDTLMDVQSQAMERLATQRASLTALADHLSALRSESAHKEQRAEAALVRARAARDAAEAANVRLETLADRQATQAAAVKNRLARDEARLDALEAEQANLKKVLAQRAREAKRRAAEARKRAEQQRNHTPSKPSRGDGGGSAASEAATLSRPSVGRISSEFGMRFHPIYKRWKLHSGRDYAASCGSPVRAAASGTVVMAGDGGGYGNRVVLDHGLVSGVSLATTYNHMQSIRVWSGRVSRGDVVGYIGTTGTSTGCHLHFETLEDGDFVDPREWL